MESIILVVHVAIAISIIGLVLLQQGKGADMGAAFGSGASQTVFGSQGSSSFLSRATAVLATVFFITSLMLAYNSGQSSKGESSIIDMIEKSEQANDVPAPVPFDVPIETAPTTADDVPQIPVEEVTTQPEPATTVPAPPIEPPSSE